MSAARPKPTNRQVIDSIIGASPREDIVACLEKMGTLHMKALDAMAASDLETLIDAIVQGEQQAGIILQAASFLRGAHAIIGQANVVAVDDHETCENPTCPIHAFPREEDEVH